MSVSPFTGALALILLCLPAGGRRPEAQAANPEQAIRALERRWLAGEDNADTLEAMLAEDFVHVLPFGFITKRQQVDYARSQPAPPPETKHFEDLRVRVFASAGVATGVVVATAADGRVRKTAFTDVFAQRDGRWQAVSAQELSLGEPTGSGAAPAAKLPPNVRQDVDAGNQAWIDGLEAGDAERAVAGFAPEAVSCGATGACVQGAAAIAGVYRDVLARFGRASEASVRSETLHVDRDLAYESGQSEARFAHGAVRAGRFSTVWQRQPDGHWKIYRNMGLPAARP